MSRLFCLGVLIILGMAIGCRQDTPQKNPQGQPTEWENKRYIDPSLLTPFANPLTTFVRRVHIDKVIFEKHHKHGFAFEPSSEKSPAFEVSLKKALSSAGHVVVRNENDARLIVEYVYRTNWHSDTSHTSLIWFYDTTHKCLLTKVPYQNYLLDKQADIIADNNKKIQKAGDVKIGAGEADLRMKMGAAEIPYHPFLRERTHNCVYRPDMGKAKARVFLGRAAQAESKQNTFTDFAFEMDYVSQDLRMLLHELGLDLTPERGDADLAIVTTLDSATFGEYVDSRILALLGPGPGGNPGYHLREQLLVTDVKAKKQLYSVELEGKTPERFEGFGTPLTEARNLVKSRLDAALPEIRRVIQRALEQP